jgi:hypothetical protein
MGEIKRTTLIDFCFSENMKIYENDSQKSEPKDNLWKKLDMSEMFVFPCSFPWYITFILQLLLYGRNIAHSLERFSFFCEKMKIYKTVLQKSKPKNNVWKNWR